MFFLFWVLLVLSLVCFGWLLLGGVSWLIRIDFLSLSGSYWGLNVIFDVVSVGILLMLVICFLYVYYYTGHYFGDVFISRNLNSIICLFVGVMGMLVCTGDFLLTLIFWEYLGVVSFFLILFYSNYLSLRASVVTLVSSRFGDVCLFMLICVSGYMLKDFLAFTLIAVFLIVFSKSASFPFTSWLLEAMRAPTPVSALVHSSTLVAAGVWFSMRYDFLLLFNNCFTISVLLLVTIIVTGVSCFFFLDLKKIVALSTCNNIAWCVFYLIFGDVYLALFQLVSHGVSKCMLFMLVGDVMSGSAGAQASNCVYNSRLYGSWGIFGLFSIILGLSGAPYVGVFFTKHFLLSGFMNVYNLMFSGVVLFCVFLSYFYSFRFCSILVNAKASSVVGVLYLFNSGAMVYFWLFINYFISLFLDESVSLNALGSCFLIIFQVFSCLTAWFMYSSVTFSWLSSSLFGSDNVVEYFYEFFFNVLDAINIFLYRWDNNVLSLFLKFGSGVLSVYVINVLNFTVLAVLIILVSYVII